MSFPDGKARSQATSLTNRIRREDALDRFEAAWQSGSRPSLPDFLALCADESQPGFLRELLRLDCHYRRQLGQTPSPSDYIELGPEAVREAETALGEIDAAGSSSLTRTPRPQLGSGSQPVLPWGTTAMIIGSKLGPYELLEKLGQGGMGAVYKARHQHLDKLVAVKVLPVQFTQHAESVARFKREMKAVGKIDHPHIVRAMDAGEIDGVHFLAMEYVEGTDLSQFVKAKGPFSVGNACKAIRQAALALAAAHNAGLIHRDVKPSNLLLTKTGQIKLLDLGLARLAEDAPVTMEVTADGQAFGTPDYMAPEQWADSHAADARADLYALGCTLFFLLTGRAPYGDERHRHPLNKMSGHMTEPIPDLKAARSEVPDAVDAIYRKLMAKNPDERFQAATELVETLVDYAAGKPTIDRPSAMAANGIAAPADRTAPIAAEKSSPVKPTGPEDLSTGTRHALIDSARQCFEACDYAQTIELLQNVPKGSQSKEMAALLKQARDREAECVDLQTEIEEARRRKKFKSLLPKAERLLQLKPGHAAAKKLAKALQTYGGNYARVRFDERGDIQPLPPGAGFFAGLGAKYLALIAVAAVAFIGGGVLIAPYFRNSSPAAEPVAANDSRPEVLVTEEDAVGQSPSDEAESEPVPGVKFSRRWPFDPQDGRRYAWSKPENLGPGVNSSRVEMVWSVSDDECALYFSRNRMFVSFRPSKAEQFGDAGFQNLVRFLSPSGAASADGLVVVGSKLNEQNIDELFLAQREDQTDPFPEPEKMPAPVNSDAATLHPVLSPDGLTLLACSGRAGSASGDVWMFTRETRDQAFGQAERLPEPVNTPEWDMPAYISNDRRFLIASDQRQVADTEQRTFRYFTRESERGPFSPPQDVGLMLGDAVASDNNGGYRLSSDGRSIYFHTDRLSDSQQLDIYVCRRVLQNESPAASDPD